MLDLRACGANRVGMCPASEPPTVRLAASSDVRGWRSRARRSAKQNLREDFIVITDAINRVFVWAQVAAKREEGQAMVEYGLIVALIAVVAVTAVALIGTKVTGTFNGIAGSL